MELIKPTEGTCWEREWQAVLDEFAVAGERVVPWGFHYGRTDFSELLRVTWEREKPDYSGVSATTLWLTEDNRILGMVNIRHRLDDSLRVIGGLIGYGVRPSERRRGYATYMLGQALEICRQMGLDRVLLTCDADNEGSRRTILKNGGLYDSGETHKGVAIERYWIPIG